MNSIKYDHEGRLRRREEFLRNIPAPDDVFIAAAKNAVMSAGIGNEVVEVLHPETLSSLQTPMSGRL